MIRSQLEFVVPKKEAFPVSSKHFYLLILATFRGCLVSASAQRGNRSRLPRADPQVATAKPDIYLSVDGSGSMGACPNGNYGCSPPNRKVDIAKDVITTIVNHPQVGGTVVNYGYQEWSSERVGSCRVSAMSTSSTTEPGCGRNLGVAGLTDGWNTPQDLRWKRPRLLSECDSTRPSALQRALRLDDHRWNVELRL